MAIKYRGIFGVVLLLHLALGVVIITQPGCQSAQTAEKSKPNPVIGPVTEEELAEIEAQEAAQQVEESDEDLFRPLDSSFNTGSPEPIFVSGQSMAPESVPANTLRNAPLRPALRVTPEPSILDYSPVPEVEEPVPAQATITVVSEEPVEEPYVVQSGDSLWAISKKFGVSVPAIRTRNALASDSLKVGQELVIPGGTNEIKVAAPRQELVAPALSRDVASTEYVVVPRDTLSGIAAKTGVSVSVIRSANNLRGDLIKVGDVLLIPNEARGTSPISARTAPAPSTRAPAADGIYHVVKSGENPTVIARRYGLSVKELIQKNGNFDPRALRVGQRLLVGDLAAGAEQSVEVDAPAPLPAVPEGFQAIKPQSRQSIGVEIPAAEPVESTFDEEAFIREMQGAPIVSPVPVEE